MPQELTMPIASPRSGGYQPGNEVTVGGQTFTVVGTNQDGLPLLAPKSGFREDASQAVPSPKTSTPSGNPLANLMAKRERIAALPENIRGVIIDRLFDKVMSPRIPKAMDDIQRGQIRKNFENAILGQSPEMLSTTPSEAEYKRAGLPTGAGGKVQEGVMRGTGNVLSLYEKGSDVFDKVVDATDAFLRKLEGRDKVSQKSLSDLVTGQAPRTAAQDMNLSAPFLQSADALHQATFAYAGRHPFKAGAAEFGGQLLPAILTEKMVPAGAPGGGLATKVATGAVKGGAGMVPFDPSLKGISTGAVLGGGLPILGKAAGKAKAALLPAKAATKVAPAATAAVTGAAEGSEAKLEALAQKAFGKSLRELSPDQKIELVNKWRDESVAAAKTEKIAARKAALNAKTAAVTAKATEKIDQRIATRKAMDEAKALQKQISAFIKTNKRAPNEEELLKMKAAPAAAAPVAAAEGRGAGLAARGEKGSVIPERGKAYATSEQVERRALPRSTRAQLYTSELSQIRKDITSAESEKESLEKKLTDPQTHSEGHATMDKLDQVEKEITYHKQRLTVKMDEYKKAMETPLSDQFRVESPEAIKAVSAVADVSKVAGVSTPTTVGSAAAASADTLAFQKAKELLGPNASISEVALKAQEIKTGVTKVPEGVHGTGPLGKRAKDAERVAKARELAKTTQPEPAAPGTPESALLAKEEEFMNLTDQIEALGPKGKEAAKNLDKFRRTGKITMDMAIEMGTKVLETLQKGGVK